jgi:hypothetical protein
VINATEHQVGLAAKLYECRRAARSVHGADYANVMKAYGEIIAGAVGGDREKILPTAIEMAKMQSGFAAINVLAAAVELLERSEPA